MIMEKENNISEERKRSAFANAMSNYGLEMQLIEETKMEIIDLLRKTGRENIDKVVEWLEQNRFFEAMASINHHNHYYGGLACHSLNVYHLATKMNAERETPLPEDSGAMPGNGRTPRCFRGPHSRPRSGGYV